MEMLVTPNPERTAAPDLSTDKISTALKAADARFHAGGLRGTETDLELSISGEITSQNSCAPWPARGHK